MFLKIMRFKINKLGALSSLGCESTGYTFNALPDFSSTTSSFFKPKTSRFLHFHEQGLYRETPNTIRSTSTRQKLTALVYKHPELRTKLLCSDRVQHRESSHPRGKCISVLDVEAIQTQLSFFGDRRCWKP